VLTGPRARDGYEFAIQQPADDLEGLREPRGAMVEGEPEGVEVGPIPAGSHSHDEPAAAQLIDRGCDLREDGRWMEVEAGDERPQPDESRDGGEPREERPRFPGPPLRPAVAPVEVVVADPDRVEPRLLRRQRHGRVLGPANLALHLRELDAEPGSRWHGRQSRAPAGRLRFNHPPCRVDSTCMTGDGSRVRTCALVVVLTMLV